MTNCDICDHELINGEFEEKLGICVNCIMIDSRKKSFKSLLIIFLIFLGWMMLIPIFFQIILMIPSFIIEGFENYSFLIPPLTVCIIIGPGVIYLTFLYKFR